MTNHIDSYGAKAATGATFFVGAASTAQEAGRSLASFYRDIKTGIFVPPVRLGPKRSAWLKSEVAAINAARIRGASDQEIKALVQRLVQARKTAGGEVAAC